MTNSELLSLYNECRFLEIIELCESYQDNIACLQDSFILLDSYLETSDLSKSKDLISQIQNENLSSEDQAKVQFFSYKLLFMQGLIQQAATELSSLLNSLEPFTDPIPEFEYKFFYCLVLYYKNDKVTFKNILDEFETKNYQNKLFLLQIALLRCYYLSLTSNYSKVIDLIEKEITNPLLLSRALERARFFHILGWMHFRTENITKAIDYALKSEAIAQSYHFYFLLSEILTSLTSSNMYRGDFRSAEKYCLQGIELCKNIGNNFDLGRHHGNLANIYAFEGKYSKAIDHYLQTYEYFGSLGYEKFVSFTLNNIANIYKIQGNFQQAKSNYLESLQKMLPFNDQLSNANRYKNLGDICYRLQELQESNDYFLQAYVLYKQIDNKYQILSTLYHLLIVQNDLGISVSSNPLLDGKEKYVNELPVIEAKYLQIRSLMFQDQGNFEKAISLLQEANNKAGVEFEDKMLNYENIMYCKLLQLRSISKLSLELVQESGIPSLLSTMEKIANDKHMYPDLCKIYILMYKFSHLVNDSQRTQKYIDLALKITKDHDMKIYTNEITRDQVKINEQDNHTNLQKQNDLLNEMTEYVQSIGIQLNKKS